MKVSIFDQFGNCIGIAWHENNEGVVEFDPATREVVAVFFSINDGPKRSLDMPLLMPVDAPMRLYITKPSGRDVHNCGDEVDESATKMSWWRRVWRWFVESAATHRHD